MSEGHLRLAFDRNDGSTAPTIDLPVDHAPIHLHLHFGNAESQVAPRTAPRVPPSTWRSFWIAFGAIAVIGSVYAIGIHMGAGRLAAATALPVAVADQPEAPTPQGTGQADPLAAVQRQVAQRPVVTPPPGEQPSQAAANPFGLRP
jgi:hypothetical protein